MIVRISTLLAILSCLHLGAQAMSASDLVKTIRPNPEAGSAGAVISTAPLLLITEQIYPLSIDGRLVGSEDCEQQISQLFTNLESVLHSIDLKAERVVKLNFYVAEDQYVAHVQAELARQFRAPALPAVSFVTTRLPHPGVLVAFDAIAALDENSVARQKSKTLKFTTSVASTKTLFFISGQAEKGENLRDATLKTLLSLDASLKFCGRTKSDVRQIKCFLTPMVQSAEVRDTINSFFEGKSVPPVTYVEWQSTLPIEIEMIVEGPSETDVPQMDRIVFLTPPGMTASPVFSRICRIHDSPIIFVSGLSGTAEMNGTQQVEFIFRELSLLLAASGSDLKHLAKATYYVSQDDPSQKLNELRPKYYDPKSPPAASKAQVRGVGKPGIGLTLDMIAVPVKTKE